MKFQWFTFNKISIMCSMMMGLFLTGCVVPVLNGKQSGPPSGVVEMDQNTDPRFFFRNQQDFIGRLKVAGNEVRLDGKKVRSNTRIRNGAHVSTGSASAAIIEFFPSMERDCAIEVREFRYGRLYGLAAQCGQIVTTNQGAMETRGSPTSYHVETHGGGETVFTAIKGHASVWLHSNPSYVVVVPSYHQVRLLQDQISTPRMVTPAEVTSITRWRENFRRYRQEIDSTPTFLGPYMMQREPRRPRPPQDDYERPVMNDGKLY
jgi:hypothetical protein